MRWFELPGILPHATSSREFWRPESCKAAGVLLDAVEANNSPERWLKAILYAGASARYLADMESKTISLDRWEYFLKLLGWSTGDAAVRDDTGRTIWQVFCRRDDQNIVA